MATANLLNVATPGPALAITPSNGSSASTFTVASLSNYCAAAVTETAAGTGYQLDSVTLTQGVWCVAGLVIASKNTQTAYLNTVGSGTTDSWPVKKVMLGGGSSCTTVAAVIRVPAGGLTVYLCGSGSAVATIAQGFLTATQIG